MIFTQSIDAQNIEKQNNDHQILEPCSITPLNFG